MESVLWFFYKTGIKFGELYIYFGKLFSKKLALLYNGRRDTWKKISTYSSDNKVTVWVHCASLGEFEQGRPIIERIKKDFPEVSIALSFFSSSGYEIRKNYESADLVFYLPSDLEKYNQILIDHIKPSMVIFVKSEFWWNLIHTLIHKRIDVYLISGVFREKDYFFKLPFHPWRDLLARFTKIFVQNKLSADILRSNEIKTGIIAGDSRIDSVIQRSKLTDLPEKIKHYVANKNVIIYGSIWPSDMKIVRPLVERFTDFVHILAPHDVRYSNIVAIKKAINQNSVVYSDDLWNSNVLIINNIGMLSNLYSLGKYAYIGGGFQNGIHNTLEPAVFGIPVFFGPNHNKFIEAILLKELGIAYSVKEPQTCFHIIDTFESDNRKYSQIKNKSNEFFTSNSGAAEKIISEIYPNLTRWLHL